MATIATTTNTTPFIYPGVTLLDRKDGTGTQPLYCMVKATTADNYTVYRSTDNGVNWSSFLNVVRTNVVEIGPIFVHDLNYLMWCYRTNESSQDRIYFRRLRLADVAWDNEFLVTAASNGGVAGAVYTGMDMMPVKRGGTVYFYIPIVVGYTSGASHGAQVHGVLIDDSTGVHINANSMFTGTRQWLSTGSGRITPSIDMEHWGNAKNSSVLHIWIAFGRATLQMVKLSWNGSGWNMPTSAVVINGSITATDSQSARWDGTRFLMPIASGSSVLVYERNKANSSTTLRTSPTHTTGVVRNCSISYSSTSGDFRVYAVGTSSTVLYYVDYIRATGTWSGWSQVHATAITGTAGENYGVRRSSYYSARYDVYTRHASNTATHTSQTLAYAPFTPTWTTAGLSYTDGGAADVAATLVLDWVFTDPDTSDVQGSYAVSRQIGAGALNYWRASDSTWQVAEVQNTSASTTITLPVAWGVDGAAAHAYKVKVWDAGGTASVYSAPLTVIPSAKVNPTIALPVDSSTVVSDTVTVTWTVAEQTAFQVQTLIFGLVLQDSGKVQSTATSYISPERLADTFSYTIKLWTWNNDGLQSDPDQNSFSVSYVTPGTPSCTVSPQPTLGYITVTTINPPAASFVNAGTVTHGNNASVTPGLPAGMQTGDAMLVLSAIRNSGTGVPDLPTDYTNLCLFGNVRLSGKIHDGSEAAPLQTFTGGAANADTSSQMAAFRNMGLTVIGTSTILNGSAQNVTYSALSIAADNCVVLYIAWKQDAWTSAAQIAGAVEIGDLPTATGSDQSLAWDYLLQTVATNIAGSSFTITGGISAISRGIVIALSGRPDVTGNDIYRLKTGDALTNEVRVAADVAVNGSYNDWRASAVTDWSYKVIAKGDNGTSNPGLWTP